MDPLWRVQTTLASEIRADQLAGMITALMPGAKVYIIPVENNEENRSMLPKIQEICSVCGLPREDHIPSKPGNVPRAGSCIFTQQQKVKK